ncbi:MAG TPA: zinc-ribbon domain-containing protein [Mucilaginibacter sp.]|nr:zinc-ribbon domain-containing protein [Mucilaginibacter sp.]
MIVYGRRATALTTQVLFEPCPNCRATNSIHITVYQRYAHIFWIPMFPLNKTGTSVCSNCRQVLKLGDMPPGLRLAYDNIKSHTKIPVWHFSGLGLIAAVFIVIAISDKNKAEKISKLVLNPKAGDIFELKIKDTVYTLYKIKKVEKDTVFFIANKYQTNDETGLSNLFLKDFDDSVSYGFPKIALVEMNRKGDIIDIDRH